VARGHVVRGLCGSGSLLLMVFWKSFGFVLACDRGFT